MKLQILSPKPYTICKQGHRTRPKLPLNCVLSGMVNRIFKTINCRAILEPQSTSNHDSREENARFCYNTFSWTANKISTLIAGYHRTYLALEVVHHRIDTTQTYFLRITNALISTTFFEMPCYTIPGKCIYNLCYHVKSTGEY